ncbi:MAG: Rieske (2Fe-2S) protein [Rhodoferax sp.]
MPMSEWLEPHSAPQRIPLCASQALQDSALAVPFDVLYLDRPCRAFAVRFDGKVYAYLNRCAHVPMEMDYQPNQFFDHTGRWLMCATHGAMYRPETGECRAGPCRGGLVVVAVTEEEGQVYWHTSRFIQAPGPIL